MTAPDSHSRRDFFVQAAGALTAIAIVPDLLARPAPAADKLPLALVGCGKQGRAIIAECAKLDNAKLVAVCDIIESRRSGALRQAPDAEAFESLEALLAKRTDVVGVIIATPTHLHKDLALAALAAGKHVYCEAPLAHTEADCTAIAAAAAKAQPKQLFAVGLEGRSNPVYKLARTFFRSDAVRDLVSIQAQQYQKTSWRVPSSDPAREKELNWRLDPALSLGLAGEWGVHALDVALWYSDKKPTAIMGSGSIRLHQDGRTIHDTIAMALTLEGGAAMTYHASLANSYEGRYELLRGTNAAIKLAWTHGWMFKEADAPTQGWEVYANRQQFHNDEGITLIADATKLASQGKLKDGVGLPNSSLYYALWDFADAITNNKQPACDAQAGAQTTIVAIKAAQAIATGNPMTL
jgi:predicted dehydrogenase